MASQPQTIRETIRKPDECRVCSQIMHACAWPDFYIIISPGCTDLSGVAAAAVGQSEMFSQHNYSGVLYSDS